MKNISKNELSLRVVILSTLYILLISCFVFSILIEKYLVLLFLIIFLIILSFPLVYTIQTFAFILNIQSEEIRYGQIKEIHKKFIFNILIIENDNRCHCFITLRGFKKMNIKKVTYILNHKEKAFLINVISNDNLLKK